MVSSSLLAMSSVNVSHTMECEVRFSDDVVFILVCLSLKDMTDFVYYFHLIVEDLHTQNYLIVTILRKYYVDFCIVTM